jgi:putative endonuclease
MSCFVYIIGSFKEGKFTTYVGWTNDIDERLNKHNSNKGAKSTKRSSMESDLL